MSVSKREGVSLDYQREKREIIISVLSFLSHLKVRRKDNGGLDSSSFLIADLPSFCDEDFKPNSLFFQTSVQLYDLLVLCFFYLEDYKEIIQERIFTRKENTRDFPGSKIIERWGRESCSPIQKYEELHLAFVSFGIRLVPSQIWLPWSAFFRALTKKIILGVNFRS